MAFRYYLSFLFMSSIVISVDGMQAETVAKLPDGQFIAQAYIFGEHECSPEEWPAVLTTSLLSVLPNPAETEQRGVPFPELRFFYECFLRELDAVPHAQLPEYKRQFVSTLTERCRVFLAVRNYQELRDMVAALQPRPAQSEKADQEIEGLEGEELAGLHKKSIESLISRAKKQGAKEPAVCSELVSVVTHLKQIVCGGLVPIGEFNWVMLQLSAILGIANGANAFDQKQLTTIMTSCTAMLEAMQKPLGVDKIQSTKK
jgi:hypothetical protein